MSMEIIRVVKQRQYALLTAVFAVFMFLFLPYVQSLGLINNLDLWYGILLEQNYGLNAVLFAVFSILFGMYVSFMIAKFRGPKVCSVQETAKKGAAGTIGSAFAFIVGVCPACVGFAGLFLPLGIVTTLVVFGPVFMLVSIGLILLSIRLNGGFKKHGA